MVGQPGFFDLDERYRALSAACDALERLASAVDFELFRPELETALDRSDGSRGGRPPYDVVLMFKVLVLQTLYTLSDDQTEFQIRDRLSFMRFVGLGLHEPVPDAKTIWLFREQLTRAGAIERLFQRFDRTLRERGVLAMGGQILDATIVQARPARRAQIDRDARWTLKRGRRRPPPEDGSNRRQAVEIAVPLFGYKSHIGIDRQHGLIRTWAVTHAAAHDGGQLADLLDAGNTAAGVWADTAYRSAANLATLAKRAMVPHLQRPKPRGKPMPPNVRRGNATRGKVRAAVEHVFACQKQRLRLVVRTIGLARATTRLGLANLAYNLLRFTWLEAELRPHSAITAPTARGLGPSADREPQDRCLIRRQSRHAPRPKPKSVVLRGVLPVVLPHATATAGDRHDHGCEDSTPQAEPARAGAGSRQRQQACRIVGYSRQQFYEIRRNFQAFGAEGLVDKMRGPKGPHPNRLPPEIEAAILDHALEHPTHGPTRVAQALVLRGLQVSAGGVRGVWSRHDLLTKHEWLLRLEKATAERTIELTAEQARLLERFSPEFRERHIEAPHTGALVAVDTFFVGVLKGVGNVYLQTAIDCHLRYAWAKLFTNKMPLTTVQTLNNEVLPTFDEHEARIETVLSDNGREFCGRPDQHPYELFLQLEGIEHKTTRVGRPQSNGIVERLHRTLLDEHLRVQGRTVWYETVEEMQKALDSYLLRYNTERPHQGRGMEGRTPLRAFIDGLPSRETDATPETLAA